MNLKSMTHSQTEVYKLMHESDAEQTHELESLLKRWQFERK